MYCISPISRRSVGILILFLAVIVAGGCNRSDLNLAPVEGVVTLDDKPVEDAAVLFLPDDPKAGPPATGTTDAQGRFTLVTANQPGAAIGSHRVAITKDQTQIIPQQRGFPLYKTTYTIPPKYADANSSQLTAVVKDDDNRIDFNLTSQ